MARPKGGGKTPGSGRKKGTTNKANQAMRDLIELETGGEPIPQLLARIGMRLMNDDEHSMAINAFRECAKYGYQQLKAIEHSGEVKTGPTMVIVQPGERPEE